MVVDTSAVIAILFGEPETECFVRALADDSKKMISAFNALESAIVIEAKKGEAGGRELDLLLHRARIEMGVALLGRPLITVFGLWYRDLFYEVSLI
jgi:ribonuclease VapC